MEIEQNTLDIEDPRIKRTLSPERMCLSVVNIPTDVESNGVTARFAHRLTHLLCAARANKVELGSTKLALQLMTQHFEGNSIETELKRFRLQTVFSLDNRWVKSKRPFRDTPPLIVLHHHRSFITVPRQSQDEFSLVEIFTAGPIGSMKGTRDTPNRVCARRLQPGTCSALERKCVPAFIVSMNSSQFL